MSRTLTVSLLLHAAVIGGLYAAGLLTQKLVPAPQAVLSARLVRLGPAKDDKLLPTLQRQSPVAKAHAPPLKQAKSPASEAPKDGAPGSISKSPAAKSPATAAAQAARTQTTLERLRKQMAGAADGDVQGDADDALAGDRYTAAVERCMRANFVIEGTEPLLVQNRRAQALVRIAASGKVIYATLSKSSGLAAFDNAVLRAVRLCSEVPPPPVARREQLRRAGIEVTFRP